MADRCLITGCGGFLGSHLADLLVEKGLDVFGAIYPNDTRNIDHLQGRLALMECDMRRRGDVEKIVQWADPDYVFHLAAQSFVTSSWDVPEETYEANVMGTFYLFESLREARKTRTIEVVSSSAVYGLTHEDELPIVETKEFRPSSHYGVSKVATDMLGHFYWQAYQMPVIRVRPFNMTGPRKTDDACSDFAKGVSAVELGLQDVHEVGNLDTVRDFTDGRDAAKALWVMAEKGAHGEAYNLCSGTGHSIREVLELVLSLANRPVEVRHDPDKLRLTDDPVYIGDNSKLRGLGWQPEIPWETTLGDSLNYWRERQRPS